MTAFPTPPGRPDDPDLLKVLTEIDMIAHMVQNEFERLLPAGITQAQYGVLNRLIRLDTMETVGELARAFQVTQPTMTSTLKKLREKSLIAFVPDDTDRRVKQVSVTEAGKDLRDGIVSALEPFLIQESQAIGEIDHGALLSHLGRIRQHFETRMDSQK